MWKSLLKYSSRTILPEQQYLTVVNNVLRQGERQKGRNGNTYNLFGQHMRFSLRDGTVPVLTTKKMAWRSCLKELLWFMRGQTDNTILQGQNVHIWDDNASKEFMSSSTQTVYSKEGDLGPIYGHQWRHFNAHYEDCEADYSGKGVDQLQNLIDGLKYNKFSRRLIISAWNPCQLGQMALPPCHILSQFSVNTRNELSCIVYQRSGDLGLGIPFNIASYSFMLCLLAKHCNLQRGELIHFIGNAHIYEEHREALCMQIGRIPFQAPTFVIGNQHAHIDDYVLSDCKLTNYRHHDAISMKMIP